MKSIVPIVMTSEDFLLPLFNQFEVHLEISAIVIEKYTNTFITLSSTWKSIKTSYKGINESWIVKHASFARKI